MTFSARGGVLVLIMALMSGLAGAAPRVRVMLLDGESGGPYHKWRLTTPLLKKALDETGLFEVDVVTAPAATGELKDFRPDFKSYRAVVMNYDAPDERWTAELKAEFEAYMKAGGGLVVVHAADNAFSGWPAFNEMTGVGGWRGRTEKSGPYWFIDGGKLLSDPSPGNAGSHGARLPFAVTIQDNAHPITKGLPATWMHQGDELYAKLRGPGRNMTVLATAYSDPANAGSGRHEPMLMVLSVRQGPHLPHDARPRRQRHELRRLRDHPAARRPSGPRPAPSPRKCPRHFPRPRRSAIGAISRPSIRGS